MYQLKKPDQEENNFKKVYFGILVQHILRGYSKKFGEVDIKILTTKRTN